MYHYLHVCITIFTSPRYLSSRKTGSASQLNTVYMSPAQVTHYRPPDGLHLYYVHLIVFFSIYQTLRQILPREVNPGQQYALENLALNVLCSSHRVTQLATFLIAWWSEWSTGCNCLSFSLLFLCHSYIICLTNIPLECLMHALYTGAPNTWHGPSTVLELESCRHWHPPITPRYHPRVDRPKLMENPSDSDYRMYAPRLLTDRPRHMHSTL